MPITFSLFHIWFKVYLPHLYNEVIFEIFLCMFYLLPYLRSLNIGQGVGK